MTRHLADDTLNSILKRCFEITVPPEKLRTIRTLGDALSVISPLVAGPNCTRAEKLALERKIEKVFLISYTRTKHQVVFDFICVQCGQRLGAEALRLANEHWRRKLDDLHAQRPGQFISLIRDVDAVCSQCGREYSYDSEQCALRVRATRG